MIPATTTTKVTTKITTPLTARGIEALKPREKAYYISDNKVSGLALRVAPDGSKSWSVRYRVHGHQRRLTLGNADSIRLGDDERDKNRKGARTLARQAVQAVANGIDPAQVKTDKRTADTVESFSAVYMKKHGSKKKSAADDLRMLTYTIVPAWRHRLMTDITKKDVRTLIEKIAERGAPIAANRVRSLVHKFFNIAIEQDVVTFNPVIGTRKPGIEHQRDRVLTDDEIRLCWAATETLPLPMKAFFQLRLVTAQRGGEVSDMRWSDVDLTSGWWTIPATGSKNKLAHRVPLSKTALDLIAALRVQATADDARRIAKDSTAKPAVYVLAEARGKRQHREAAATFGISDFHGHDLRRTAASLMTGSGTPRLVVSKILNHAESGITSVYDRHSYDGEKRIALDNWARVLTSIIERQPAAVLPFAKR
jgi:integrase